VRDSDPENRERLYSLYCVEKLRFWQEHKKFSPYEKFYYFRYEGPYVTHDSSATGLTFAYARELHRASGKYVLKLNFGFFRLSSFSTEYTEVGH